MEEKKEKKIYQYAWFWILVALMIVGVCCGIINNSSTVTNTSGKVTNNTTNSEEVIKENPYKVTNDYDGIYKFSLNDNNGSGHIFTSVGAIQIKGNKCKLKYSTSSDTIAPYNREYDGFCGYKENDEDSFYITAIRKTSSNSIYDDAIYRCKLNEDKNLSCILESGSNLAGCYSNKSLDLIYVENANNIDDIVTQVVGEEKAKKDEEEKIKKQQEEQEFKSSCEIYTFEEIARNPTNFKGTNVKLTGEVVQTLYNATSVSLRVNITKKGSYSNYYTDTIYVNYYPKANEDKILEKDIITIYGTAQGEYTYTSTIGAKVTLPYINCKYLEIEK